MEVIYHRLDYTADGSPIPPEAVQALHHFEIESFPTIIVANSKGKILGRATGAQLEGPGAYLSWVRSL